MANEQIETARRQQLEAYERAQARLGMAKLRLRDLWRSHRFASGTYQGAAVAAMELELQIDRLHIANEAISAALSSGVAVPLAEAVGRLAQLEEDLTGAIFAERKPQSIVHLATRLVTAWVRIAQGDHGAQLRAVDEPMADDAFGSVMPPPGYTLRPILAPFAMTQPFSSSDSTFSTASPGPVPSYTPIWGTLAPERFEAVPGTQLALENYSDAVSASVSALGPVPESNWQTLQSWPSEIDPGMDPRLQVAIARHNSGSAKLALASTSADEIAVIAEVDNIEQWEGLSEVRIGVRVGTRRDDRNVSIVTARIPIERIDHIRRQPFVRSLTAARPIRPTLEATIDDMQVTLPSVAGVTNGGQGVVVGIVDFGCDFAHWNFRNADGSTRIEALWVQAGHTAKGGVAYGRLYTRADIDLALQSHDPYQALGYGQDLGKGDGSHGTHVMDIAAGNGMGSKVPGCAPGSTIIFVDLSPTDIHWYGPDAVGQSLGDSVRLLEAVDLIFARAEDRPCVVNLSLGTNGGPHDGTTPVEQGLDDLLTDKPNRAVTIAAGNSHGHGIHQHGTISPGAAINLVWKTRKSPTGQEMEIWIPAVSRVAVEVIAPDGTNLGVTEPGDNSSVGSATHVVLYVANQLNNSSNNDNLIGIYLAGTVGQGSFTVRLTNRGAIDAPFHAWIERDDKAQSSFASPTANHTLGSISCGHETICVGSYDAHKPQRTLSYFSSNGPTRDGRLKPELSAPGHAVFAAQSGTSHGVTKKSGTSMATPAVSGLIALLFAEAAMQGKTLSSTQLRNALIQGVNPNPSGAQGWDAGYGHGRASSTALKFI